MWRKNEKKKKYKEDRMHGFDAAFIFLTSGICSIRRGY
jgi:hypothetical protein